MLRLTVRAFFCLAACAPALFACTPLVDRQDDDSDSEDSEDSEDNDDNDDDECQVADDCDTVACVCTNSIVNNQSCQNGDCEGAAGCTDACAAFGEDWTGDTL
jgi:hypothetical protein